MNGLGNGDDDRPSTSRSAQTLFPAQPASLVATRMSPVHASRVATTPLVRRRRRRVGATLAAGGTSPRGSSATMCDDSSRSHWNCVWVDRHYEKRAWVSLECTADRLEHLFFGEHAQLPAITIGVMEPQAHVFRARGFRTDFVAWIFNIDVDLLQMSERLSQCRHVR